MTCRPRSFRHLLVVVGMVFGLTSCGETGPELSPIEEAQQLLQRGDGFGAELVLREMLDTGSTPQDVAAYLGQAELQQGQLAEARHWLADTGFADGTQAHGFHMLGRLEFREGNLTAAGQAFDRAYDFDEQNAELWVDVGRLRFRGGEQAQAIEASIRAVEIDPENPAALRFRAQLVRDAEGLRAALPWFEAALEHNPDDIDLLADYAATLGDLGRARDMLATVRRMAEIDARDWRILYYQAVLAARADKFDLARSLIERGGPVMVSNPAGMQLSGVVDLQNGNYQSAAQTFDRLSALQPENRRVKHLLARSLSMALSDDELIYRYAKAAERPSASPYLRRLVGRAYEATNDRMRAAEFLNAAAIGRGTEVFAVDSSIPLSVARSRNDGSGANTLALVRGQIIAGRSAAAVRDAETFRKRFPGSADAMALAGDAYRANGKSQRAIDMYSEAANIRSTWPLLRRIAAAHRAVGKTDSLESLFAKAVLGNPSNAEASAELARIAIAEGDWQRAAILLDNALDHGSGRDASVWVLRSFVARQLGDDELAYDAAVFAYALQPMQPETTALLASLLGEYDQAETAGGLSAKLSLMGR